jgi:hypothetical protein
MLKEIWWIRVLRGQKNEASSRPMEMRCRNCPFMGQRWEMCRWTDVLRLWTTPWLSTVGNVKLDRCGACEWHLDVQQRKCEGGQVWSLWMAPWCSTEKMWRWTGVELVNGTLTFNRGNVQVDRCGACEWHLDVQQRKCAGGQMISEFTHTTINISRSTDLKSWDSIICRKNAVFASLYTILWANIAYNVVASQGRNVVEWRKALYVTHTGPSCFTKMCLSVSVPCNIR